MRSDVLVTPNRDSIRGVSKIAKRLLANGFNVNSLRTYDTLRKEEWLHFDEVVVDVARTRLSITQDLIANGLTMPLENAMGTTVLQWEKQSDLNNAERTMDALTRLQRDRLDFEQASIPIYITHKDFGITARTLAASRKLGTPLDTSHAEVAARKVADSIEDAIVNGSGVTLGSDTAYGLKNHPNRNTGSFNASNHWGATAKTGASIMIDVQAAIASLHADRMFGPYMIYVPTDAWVKLIEDFKAESDKTILQRILDIPSVQGVKVVDTLASANVLFVQMTRDVVDLVVGQQPTIIEWDTEGGLNLNFKVMAIMVPRVRADYDSRSGIFHMS